MQNKMLGVIYIDQIPSEVYCLNALVSFKMIHFIVNILPPLHIFVISVDLHDMVQVFFITIFSLHRIIIVYTKNILDGMTILH